MKEDTTGKVMETIQLTPEEAKWVAGMAETNEVVLRSNYVVLGPDGEKRWVALFKEKWCKEHNHELTYDTWSPLNDQGNWKHFGEPTPDWVLGKPTTLLQDDGFTSEEIEQAEAIMEGL